MKNVRQVTRSVAPATQAIWTLPSLSERLCEWAYDVYDTSYHGSLEQSPRAAFENGMQMAGCRTHRMIQYDEAFRILTLPTTRRGVARVSPNNGVKINNRYYWANAFRDAELANAKAPVRYDPYDIGQAYAFVKGSWVICHSEHYHVFRGRTEREMMLASSELRKRQSRSVGISKASAKQLAVFVSSLESQEALLGQRLRDIETKKVLSAMDRDRLFTYNSGLLSVGGAGSFPTNSEDSSSTIGADQATGSLDDPEVYSDY